MPRAPCCEKIGLKKGPWTAEEDQILIDYVQKYGHANWRALPKEAGLLRCGKSCRLRWINYLRPDIKRGNFSPEEEDVIINLHQLLGNRWSAIAAKLPGRTDNEIKNVWHTHLKKKVSKNRVCASKEEEINPNPVCSESSGSSDLSSVTADSSYSEANNISMKSEIEDTFESFPEIGDSFWAEALDINNSSSNCRSRYDVSMTLADIDDELMDNNVEPACSWSDQDMDFWYHVFLGTDNL